MFSPGASMADFVELKEAGVETQAEANGSELSSRQLAAIIGTAMDAIVVMDERQRVVIFNAASEKLFGCGATEAIGSPLARFIPKRFRDDHAEQVQFFGATGGTSRRMGKLGFVWGSRTDGREIALQISISQTKCEGRRFFTAIMREVRSEADV